MAGLRGALHYVNACAPCEWDLGAVSRPSPADRLFNELFDDELEAQLFTPESIGTFSEREPASR
jgi:hypothetical protein